jgi:ATPase subunit of ABC transporter with duplicated ATPase domains
MDCLGRNFTQFYSTKSERDKNLRKEYENQMEYRKHLQAFIDRWRYNANRGSSISVSNVDSVSSIFTSAAQAQSKIKILEKVRNSILRLSGTPLTCQSFRIFNLRSKKKRKLSSKCHKPAYIVDVTYPLKVSRNRQDITAIATS